MDAAGDASTDASRDAKAGDAVREGGAAAVEASLDASLASNGGKVDDEVRDGGAAAAVVVAVETDTPAVGAELDPASSAGVAGDDEMLTPEADATPHSATVVTARPRPAGTAHTPPAQRVGTGRVAVRTAQGVAPRSVAVAAGTDLEAVGTERGAASSCVAAAGGWRGAREAPEGRGPFTFSPARVNP